MINLIPKEEKKKMATDFYFRLLILFMFMLSFAVAVATISLLPAYFFSLVKDSTSLTKLQIQKNNIAPEMGEQSMATINDMNAKLNLVENAEKNKFPISTKVINEILLNKTSNIKIVQIQYQYDPIAGKTISILGTAPSRQALLTFQEALQNDPAFKNVNLPISNFVKESNLEFNLSLTPA